MATKPTPKVEKFYTIPEVAGLLSVGRTTVYDLIATGRLVTCDVGTGSRPRVRVAESDLAEYQASTRMAVVKPRRAA